MITSGEMRFIWNVYLVVFVLALAATYGSSLIITLRLWREQERMIFPSLLPPSPPGGLLQQVFRMLYSPLDARNSAVLLLVLLCFLCTVCIMYTIFTVFRDKTKILVEAVQRPCPGVGNPDRHGMGEEMD